MGFGASVADLAGLDALRERFIELNDNRAEDLIRRRGELALGAGDPRPALIEIGETAHRICGVAASLGFDELGRIALALDAATAALRGQAARAAAADPALIRAAALPHLDALIDRIDMGG